MIRKVNKYMIIDGLVEIPATNDITEKNDMYKYSHLDRSVINGDLEFTLVLENADKKESYSITANWVGGNIIGATGELLDKSDPAYVSRKKDQITICQYLTNIIGVEGFPVQTYFLQRVD